MSGTLAALLTAFSWTLTGLLFQWVSVRIGSLSLNLLRLLMAMVMISLYAFLSRGLALPIDATPNAWLWLSISGLIGFVLGDYFLFKSYEHIGARIALLIFSASPIFTGILGYFIFHETLGLLSLLGILLVLIGIGLVILTKTPEREDQVGVKLNFDPKGLLYALIATLGQSLGVITSKLGMGSYDPVASTQIRIIAAIIGFIIIYFVTGHWPAFFKTFKDTKVLAMTSVGSLFGPFIGVSLSLYAVQVANTAVASTIMSLMPVMIIPFSLIFFKERIRSSEVLGAFVAILGTTLLIFLS